jgi:hypothetical protein
VLLAVAALASLIPESRAGRVEPIEALRAEQAGDPPLRDDSASRACERRHPGAVRRPTGGTLGHAASACPGERAEQGTISGKNAAKSGQRARSCSYCLSVHSG